MDNMNNNGQMPLRQQVPPQQPPKKKNPWIIISLVVGPILLVVGILFVVAVVLLYNKEMNKDKYVDYNYTTKEYTTEDYTTAQTTEDILTTESTSVSTESTGVIGDTTRIGNGTVGYIDVPTDFVEFSEIGGLGGLDPIQYSDVTGNSIITMQAYNDMDAATMADNTYNNLLKDEGIDASSLETAQVSLGKDGMYNAYQIYCYYPDDATYLVVWCFDAPEDDLGHYLAIEFTYDYQDIWELADTYKVSE